MKRQRNRSCIYTGKVGAKMPVRKKPISRAILRRKITLTGGPLDRVEVRLDADAGFHTLPIAAMKGFPSGRYEQGAWQPDTQHEALQDDGHQRREHAEVF